MNAMFLLGMPGGSEWIVLLLVMLLLFGGTRLPQLAKGLGQSIKEFKNGIAQLEDSIAIEEPQRPQTRLQASASAGVGADDLARDSKLAAERS